MRISDWSSDVCSSDLDMIAQPHVDLHRDAVGAVGLLAAIVEKARPRGEPRGDQYDETHEADGERQQPVFPRRTAHLYILPDACRGSAPHHCRWSLPLRRLPVYYYHISTSPSSGT